ncbi:EamA-like transporter family protein [Rickettsiales bacterium Ac37b]|nr:EamA-like transporter family protein [Rickettsiales bacterium Ac37b]
MYITVNTFKKNIRGIAWMLLKCLVFTIISMMISKISHQIHIFEILFLTMLVRLLCLFPWVFYTKRENLQINVPKLYILRSILTTISLILWFYVLKITPIVEATAISYTTPLFSVIAAAIFLQEKLTSQHIMALSIGFLGAIIALHPNLEYFNRIQLGGLLTLVTACIWALTDIVSKIQSDKEHIGAQTFYNTLCMALFSLPLALMVWTTPTISQITWVMVIGLLFLINHLSLTWSYYHADIMVVAPFTFSRICFTIILAYLFFNDTPDLYSIIGATIILGSSLYILYIEKYKYNTLYR